MKSFRYLVTDGLNHHPQCPGCIEGTIMERLRAEFLRLLTEDSPHYDRRRKDFNQAIFDAERGYAVFTRVDLGDVMDKFDRAAKAVGEC